MSRRNRMHDEIDSGAHDEDAVAVAIAAAAAADTAAYAAAASQCCSDSGEHCVTALGGTFVSSAWKCVVHVGRPPHPGSPTPAFGGGSFVSSAHGVSQWLRGGGLTSPRLPLCPLCGRLVRREGQRVATPAVRRAWSTLTLLSSPLSSSLSLSIAQLHRPRSPPPRPGRRISGRRVASSSGSVATASPSGPRQMKSPPLRSTSRAAPSPPEPSCATPPPSVGRWSPQAPLIGSPPSLWGSGRGDTPLPPPPPLPSVLLLLWVTGKSAPLPPPSTAQ